MENLHSLRLFESTNFGYEERTQVHEEVDEDCEVLAEEPKKKRQKKSKAKQIKIEEDDNKRNWLDSEVEALIGLKGEMQPDFIKNAKKQEDDAEDMKANTSEPAPPSSSKKGKSITKIKYQESALELMGQMVVNGKDVAQSMKDANGFMNSLDKHGKAH